MKAENETPIQFAIRDTKLRLEAIKIDIMLMIRERDTIQKQLDLLELIDDKYPEPSKETKVK